MATIADGGQPKASVLLIVGEPFSDGDKTLILEEIVKGFRGWNCEATGVDINDELAQIANRALLGEEGPNGERIIHHNSDNIAAEILVNPQSQTVKDSLKAILTQLSPVKAVIYAGYAFQGTPAWVVQDDLFTFATFNQIFKDSNIENALKQVEGASLLLHTNCPADWTSALKGSDVERLLKVAVNPKEKLDNVHGVLQFSAYVNNFIRPVPLGSMLKASDVVGNISFTRPVLYIFPAHQGDSALFGMKGFNMLINGGFSRRACFWDFVCHLDGIDALLLTHLGPDNLFGIRAALERKAMNNIHPSIDFMYMNTPKGANGAKAIANGDCGSSNGDLVINLAAEGSRLLELSHKAGTLPHPVTRPLSGNLEPVNLYHKVGQGSLDMYVLNPVADAKEMKEFLTQWGKQAPSFSQANGIPVPNCSSVCALLVVRPASPHEKVTRILFPGSAPQHKLLEGLERVKHLEFLKHSTYCAMDSHKPKKTAAPGAGNGRAGSATRRPLSAAAPKPKAEPPKRLETKAPTSRLSSAPAASAKASKLQKDTNNKRASSAKDKARTDEKEKEDKSKSSTSSSPSKASVKSASPVKTPSSPAKTPSSPVKTPATATPEEVPAPVVAAPIFESQPPVPEPAFAEQPPPPSPQNNHFNDDLMSAESADLMKQSPINPEPFPVNDNRMADSPEALPEPERFGSDVDFGGVQQAANFAMTEREKLREMGIYDDDDEGVDNGFDDKENGGRFGATGSPEADEEDIQPQHLPEPVAAVESPTSMEPDLIQDTFTKQNAMEQSAVFEDGIEPDYSAEARDASPLAEKPAMEPEVEQAAPTEELEFEPVAPAEPEPEAFKHEEEEEEAAAPVEPTAERTPSPEPLQEEENDFAPEDLREPSPAPEELKEPSPAPEELREPSPAPEELREPSPAPEELREPSPAPEELREPSPAPEDLREPSPATEELREPSPAPEELREPSPAAEEQSFSDKEASPEVQEPEFQDDVKEASPPLEEPNFTDEHEAADNSHAIEQSIQYGVTNDSGFQMGGIREEEEEDEKEEFREGNDPGQAAQTPEMQKQAMEELGIYDDEEDEGGEADDKDAYVYEKDVNLEDEEVRMGGARREEQDQHTAPGPQDFEDQQTSIPEAFEKDETPTPVEKQKMETAADTAQTDSGREDTDSIDGGTPDDDKDIDEVLAMKQQQLQQQAQLLEQGDDDLQKQMAEQEVGAGGEFNPFVGLGDQNFANPPPADGFPGNMGSNHFEEDDLDHTAPKGGSAEFDPLSQWGPPTGLPAPAPPQEEEEIKQKEETNQHEAVVEEQEPPASLETQEDVFPEHADVHPVEGINGQDLAFHALGTTAMDSMPDTGADGDCKDLAGTEKSSEADPAEFDPLAEWGHPMGLPSPPPPAADTKAASSASKKPEPKKSASTPTKSKPAADKRPNSATKSSAAKPTNGMADPPKSARSRPDPKKASLDTSRTARPASGRSLDTSRVEAKSRTSTAAPARKPAASATKRASPEVQKMPPLPPFTPFYFDLTYIPNHGDQGYLDAEFFKRVRARNYVLSARNPNPKVLEMLIDAKASWDKSNEQEVTVIPTYETTILTHWMAVHKEKLSENKIDIAPSASRCTVRLQDHEDSCYTYRLEF